MKLLADSQLTPLTSEDLVEEDLDVVGGERLRRHDHFVEVTLHQLCYHVAAGGWLSRNLRSSHTEWSDLHPPTPSRCISEQVNKATQRNRKV